MPVPVRTRTLLTAPQNTAVMQAACSVFIGVFAYNKSAYLCDKLEVFGCLSTSTLCGTAALGTWAAFPGRSAVPLPVRARTLLAAPERHIAVAATDHQGLTLLHISA